MRIVLPFPERMPAWLVSTYSTMNGPRRQLFDRTYGAILRGITSALHAGEVREASEGLSELAKLSPPFPFNLIARLHSARLEELATKKAPEIARVARRLYERFESQ